MRWVYFYIGNYIFRCAWRFRSKETENRRLLRVSSHGDPNHYGSKHHGYRGGNIEPAHIFILVKYISVCYIGDSQIN